MFSDSRTDLKAVLVDDMRRWQRTHSLLVDVRWASEVMTSGRCLVSRARGFRDRDEAAIPMMVRSQTDAIL